MLAPFVLPEGFVVAALAFPVDVHVREEVVGAVVLQDLSDVCVLAGLVAVLIVGAIAAIGPGVCEGLTVWTCQSVGGQCFPQAVDCPMVCRSSSGIGVPELRLQKFSAGVVEAASIFCGIICAAQWEVKTEVGVAGEDEGWIKQGGMRQSDERL